MMDTQTNGCDQKRIEDFLNSDRVALDGQLVEHLDSCVSCREYLETRAAEAVQWTEAARFLKPTEFDHASSNEYSAATIGHQRIAQPVTIQSVLDSLAPTDAPNRLGRLGGYEVSGIVGVGGMGVVLKAVDPALDRVVAIKVMAPHLAHNAAARKRFSREAKAAAAVLHPNVIPIHCVSSDDAIPYLVMAYIRGGSLQKRLQREGPLTTVEILRIGSQVAAGLAAAHEQGLVHRDIKPENILLEDGVERVTLTDFGLARAVDDASVTREGTIAGTPQYMSPEQARGESVDQTSDLFSLGSVLYALCTGRPPFRADSSYGVMRRIIDETAVPIREINPEIPDWLAQIVEKLMARDKANRFESAREVHTLLESCLSHVQQPTQADLPDSLRAMPAQASTGRGFIPLLTTKIRVFTMIGLITAAALVIAVPQFTERDTPTTNEVQEGDPTKAMHLKPVSELMREANEAGPAGESAIAELLRREGKGLLDSDQMNDLIDLILKHQADRTRPWSTEMGDLIEKRWVAGKLTRDLWEQYTAQFVVGFYEVKVRPRIVIGTPGGVNLQLAIQDVRCGSGKHITFKLQEKNRVTRIGSTIIGRVNIPGTIELKHKGGQRSIGNSNSFGKQLWESIKPGKQKITFEAQLAILESPAPEKEERQDVFASRKVTFETETTFLPRGQSTVNISTDPAMKAEVDRSITIVRIETGPAVNPTTDNKFYANVRLDIKSRPIDTAFSIILKDGDNEYKAGSLTQTAENNNGLESMAFIPADLSGKRIDVILRPAPDQAELTVDLFEIWGEEIVFKNVLVTGKPVADTGIEEAKEPLTWKSLLGYEPPAGYPTEPLSLIEALNNSRGEWVFAGKIKQGDARRVKKLNRSQSSVTIR